MKAIVLLTILSLAVFTANSAVATYYEFDEASLEDLKTANKALDNWTGVEVPKTIRGTTCLTTY
jgi:hypothetical protein